MGLQWEKPMMELKRLYVTKGLELEYNVIELACIGNCIVTLERGCTMEPDVKLILKLRWMELEWIWIDAMDVRNDRTGKDSIMEPKMVLNEKAF